MGDNRSVMEIEKVIRASLKMTDVPSPELNRKLKAALRRREAVLQNQPAMRKLSLWYVPMVLNLITFFLLAFLARIIIENMYLSYFVAGSCLYVGAAGILLTLVGLKRANIKEKLTVRIEKRGVLV
ncbi:MAG: hypothetical protein OSJ59_08880 [Lachnospiraceae bacterium]|nr:hypothetical protein [Lachnospiraceae bacterium]